MATWSNRTPARKKVAEIRAESRANVLLIGNSLLDGAVLPEIFAETARVYNANLTELNAALGASEPPEQYLLFRIGIRQPHIHTAVIGFFDFQLTKHTPTNPSELIGNRALSLDPAIAIGDAESIYHFQGLSQLEFRSLRAIPLFAYRSQAWRNVELLRRSLGAIGMPKAATNVWGRASDFQALESPDVASFKKDADRRVDGAIPFNEPMLRILAESKARQINIIFLLMPASPYHRRTFYALPSWREYLTRISRATQQSGSTFIDASDWFLSEADFADRLHLSASSRPVLSRKLAAAIALSISNHRLTSGG